MYVIAPFIIESENDSVSNRISQLSVLTETQHIFESKRKLIEHCTHLAVT